MLIRKIAVTAVVLFILICTCSVMAEEPSFYINSASNRFSKKDIQGAVEVLNEGINNHPNNAQLYLNRGFIEHLMHDYESAMADYNKALAINPNFAYAYNNRGALKVSLNDIEGAMEDYAAALKINPKYSDVYYNRANLEYMLDNYNGALEDYDKAIALNPKDSDAYNNRGVVKKRMNFNVGALSDYSQAIAINPKDSIAYGNRGRLKKLYFDNEGAAIDLNQAIILAEEQTFIKNVKPLLSNRHYIAAIPTAKSLMSGSQNYVNQSDLNNEKLAMYNPNPDKLSVNTAEKPVSQLKESAKPQKNINITASNQVKPSSAGTLSAGVGKVVIPEAPDIRTGVITNNATTNVKLAESYYIRGLQKCILHDLRGAVSDLDKAIDNNSNYADAYFYRAAIKKELGDSDGFKRDYAQAIQINPSLQAYNDSNALSLIEG